MDPVMERTSGATLFGQLGCSLRSKLRESQQPSHQSIHSGAVVAMSIPRRGANHPPQTGSRYAGRRHPQSGLPFPEMLRTFQGMGREYQGVEVAPVAKAPRTPSTHLNFFLLFTEQKQPHPGPLQALQEAAVNRRRQWVRPTTRKNYLASTKTFVQFMIVHDLDPCSLH